MPMTLDKLKKLCEGEKLKYFLAPDRPMVMLGFGGINGRYQVVVPVELDGRFVQFRTVSYLHCPADHRHLEPVLRILSSLNYKLRMTKFGWDPTDGEIVGYADVWVEDGELTQAQFSSCLRCLLPAIDLNYKRLTQTLETGEDPGDMALSAVSGAGLPPELRAALERLVAGKGKGKDEGQDKDKGKDEGDDPFPTV
ncbi:MAG: YbjN domain-containing protein [Actinomycetota bacterium]